MSFNKFLTGMLRILDRMFIGKEQLKKIQEQEATSWAKQQELKEYSLTKRDMDELGPYGQQLGDLNKRRFDIAASLKVFERNEASLDVGEIREHMGLLYNDAKREAHKLARMQVGLYLGERPDLKLKKEIHNLASLVEKTKDPAVRENLIETANSKTKSLVELGKIAIYTTRVKTKVSRLDAFLGELHLGVMRASLEEEDADCYRAELANSIKAIRSSFAAVDDYRTEIKLLTESEDMKNEEVPYYLRYKEVWAGRKEVKEPDSPPQHTANHLEDIEKTNEVKAADQLSSMDQGRDNLERRSNSTFTQTEGSAPLTRTDYSVRVECPRCCQPGPFGEVEIFHNDGRRVLFCDNCHTYFRSKQRV
jgi:hypothetical protein